MSGHSKFKTIMYRKGAQDAKRARTFARIGREIMVAAKTNADPEKNPRLRAALALARSANMPKDNIKRILEKNDDQTHLDEIRYEGYGPGGVAIIVETLTDNRNRTASEVRSTFSKFGGNLGETGSVSFMFDEIGYAVYPTDKISYDSAVDFALINGAKDVFVEEDTIRFIAEIGEFSSFLSICLDELGDPLDQGLAWIPQNVIEVSEDIRLKLEKLVDVLENLDDAQTVFTNGQ